jgi:Ni,Fe-hydrogenase I cytochrome b subunit
MTCKEVATWLVAFQVGLLVVWLVCYMLAEYSKRKFREERAKSEAWWDGLMEELRAYEKRGLELEARVREMIRQGKEIDPA